MPTPGERQLVGCAYKAFMCFVVSRLVQLFTMKNTKFMKTPLTCTWVRKQDFPSISSCASWLRISNHTAWSRALVEWQRYCEAGSRGYRPSRMLRKYANAEHASLRGGGILGSIRIGRSLRKAAENLGISVRHSLQGAGAKAAEFDGSDCDS